MFKFLNKLKKHYHFNRLFKNAEYKGTSIDSFGKEWSLTQSAKLYYYIHQGCQAERSHSRYFNSSYAGQSLELGDFFKGNKNVTLRDDSEDQDFQKILGFIKKVSIYLSIIYVNMLYALECASD